MPIALLDDDATLTVKDSDLGVENGDDATTYTVRVVTPQYLKQLRKQFTKKMPTGGRGMEDVTDVEKFSEAIWDYVLVGWSGVLLKGEPIEPDTVVNTKFGPMKAKTQLDTDRKTALWKLAGANEVVADPAPSFRGAQNVL